MSNKFFKVFFDGQELTEIFDVLEGFSIPLMPEFENYTQKINFIDGEQWVGRSFNGKKLSIPFQITRDIQQKREELTKLLYKKELKKLKFSHIPNRYFNAVLDGSTEIKEDSKNSQIIKGTLVFLVPDGVSHAENKKEFTFSLNSDGQLEATLINDGTDWAYVDYDIIHNHENGYVGLVSEHGIIELGNRQETDTVQAEKSVVMTNNRAGNFSNWTTPTVFYENTKKLIVTPMQNDTQFGGRFGLYPETTFTNTKNGDYFGAASEYVLPTASTNWYLWAQAWFETGLMGQTGMWTLAIIDENNQQIASMHIYKTDKVGNTARIAFHVADGKGGGKSLKDFTFTPSYWVSQNPYGSEARDQGRNPFDILKEGNKIRFYYYGSYFSYIVPEIANMKAKRIQFFVGQFKDRTSGKQLVTFQSINNLSFTSNNVKYVKDVPNRYPAGSKIYIDGKNRKPYYNNMLRLEDEVIGTKYFRIPPGKTVVKFACSDFSRPLPTVKAYVNEVYL